MQTYRWSMNVSGTKPVPDLAVGESMLKARQIVAEMLRAQNDASGAAHVITGDRDTSAAVRAVLVALGEE